MDSLTPKEFDALRDDSKPVDYLRFSIQTLQRDPATKLYPDDKLAAILQKGTSVPAGAFRVSISLFRNSFLNLIIYFRPVGSLPCCA
jgi:hypothetical protein